MADRGFPIKIDLGKNGGIHVFQDTAELKAWLQKEIEVWGWLMNRSVSSPSRLANFQHTWRSYTDNLSNLIRDLEAKIQNGPLTGRPFENIEQHIVSQYQNHFLHSSSPDAKFVLGHKQDIERAAYIYSFLAPYDPGMHSSDFKTALLDAHTEAFLFKKGIRRDLKSDVAALNETRERWESSFAELAESGRTDAEKRAGGFGELLKEIRADQQEYKNSFNQLLNQQKKSGDSHNETAAKEYTSIIERFKNEMALKAPVTYWGRKALAHRLLACVPVVVLAVAAYVFSKTFGFIKVPEIQEHLIPKTQDPHGYGTLLVVGVGITLLIWFLRIVVRIFMSQLHLATEAAEKKVIVQTFLALMAENVIETKDKELILAALFRPSSTGIVKEDGGPAGFWELIGKIVGGK